jgi:hypothetical protein
MAFMSPRRPETYDLAALEAEFQNPLEQHATVEVESAAAAATEIARLADLLSTSEDWKSNVAAITHAMELLKGSIRLYPGGDLIDLAPHIARILTDLRPVLVRAACLLVAAQATSLQDAALPFVEVVLPALYHRLTSANSQISNCSHLALLQVARACQVPKLGHLLLSRASSDSSQERQIAAEAAHIITETWKPDVSASLAREMNGVLPKLAQDPSAAVHEIAEEARSVQRPPVKGKKMIPSTLRYRELPPKSPRASAPSSPARGISKPSPVSSPTELVRTFEEEDVQDSPGALISSVMPPQSADKARLFKRQLDDLVSSGDFAPLEPLIKLLVPSIEASVSYFRTRADWQSVLSSLLARFNAELRGQIVELADAFKFQDWILTLIAEHYSLQELAESLEIDEPQQMRIAHEFYYRALPNESFAIDVTDPVRTRVSRLIQRAPKSEASKVLREVLRRSRAPTELQGILATIINAIQNKLDWQSAVDKLAQSFDPGQPTVLQTVDRGLETLPDMLRTGPLDQKKEVVQFISTAAPKLRKVSFASSIEVLLGILIEPCDWREPIIQCLGKTLGDVKVMAQCIAKLDQADELADDAKISIIDALFLYVEEAPPQRLLPIQKAFMRKLAAFMIHDNTDIRRKAVAIFAEFQRKIPRDFSRYLRKIAPAQARLIELRANQAQAKPKAINQ